MQCFEFARHILFSPNLEDKLIHVSEMEFSENKIISLPDYPERELKLMFSEKRTKFPKDFKANESRAKALHFFANHELLAIEMMAAALLIFPHNTAQELKFKRGIVKTLKEEQKHFKLYLARMRELGIDFGDIPLNDFFWRQMHKIKSPEEYLAMMAMTFEMANLDFMLHYKNKFSEVDDAKTCDILQIVLDDEISHVAFGVNYLKTLKSDRNLWDYYCELLPEAITPARSKAMVINHEARLLAGVDDEFIKQAESYQDNYAVTNRKNWKGHVES